MMGLEYVGFFFALEDPNSSTRKKRMKLKRHINPKVKPLSL